MKRVTVWCAAACLMVASLWGCSAEGLQEVVAMRTIKLEDATLKVETIWEDDFSRATGAWLREGTPLVEVAGGRLSIDAARGEPHVATVWCTREFAADQVVEYTVRIEPTVDEKGHGETNMNFFLFASDPSGKGLAETTRERTGAYREYHALNNYILTYLNSDKQDRSPIHGEHGEQFTRVRFRKDPGFGLLKELYLKPPVAKGRDYRFTIVVEGSRMRVYVDGRKLVDLEDTDRPHRRGLHGFRTWMSHLSADGFRVSRIVK